MTEHAPVAKRIEHQVSHHNRLITDHYAWLKDPEYPDVNDPDVLAYLNAENDYFQQQMAPLKPLIDTLFEEMKARQVADDESVPYEKNGWRYQ